MKRLIPLLLVFVAVTLSWGHGISESQHQVLLDGGNLRYLWLGAVHMLTGYDHLLFLFGVIFYLTGFRDILKFITIFTLGHSITLIFATYAGITANYYLVDAIIALSVCYKAFDNLDGFPKYLKIASPNRVMVVFAFGLVHGFGLSTRLQQLPLGNEGLLLRILSFNAGVELGQIAALAALLLFLSGIRSTPAFAKAGKAANVLLLLAGLGLFVMQMQGYLSGGENVEIHQEEIHDDRHDEAGADTSLHTHGEDVPHTHETEQPHVHETEPTRSEPAHVHDGKPHSHHEPSTAEESGDTPDSAAPEAAPEPAPGPKPHSHHGGEPHMH